MQPSTIEFLRHIEDEVLFCLQEMQHISFDNFMEDEKLKRAIVRSLEIIGEASKKIPSVLKQGIRSYNGRKWLACGIGSFIIYFGVDYDTVYRTVTEDIPKLQEWLERMLNAID